MRVEITPTEKPEVLKHNLRERVDSVELNGGTVVVELEETEVLERIPGIESYTVNGEEHKGLKGSPVDEQAYARIESKRDAVKAFLATLMGYDLRILNTSREWDYRNLKRYNPDIKHLKFDQPREFLEIDKALFEAEGLEKIEIEIRDGEVEMVYRDMLA